MIFVATVSNAKPIQSKVDLPRLGKNYLSPPGTEKVLRPDASFASSQKLPVAGGAQEHRVGEVIRVTVILLKSSVCFV
eukprot:3008388-Amphidinium_carterae.1